jgi:hypothetical protein
MDVTNRIVHIQHFPMVAHCSPDTPSVDILCGPLPQACRLKQGGCALCCLFYYETDSSLPRNTLVMYIGT